MTSVKDNHNQTVIAIPFWMWFIGGLFIFFGILLIVLFLWSSGRDTPLSVFVAIGSLLFVGIFFFVGLMTKVTLDNTLGNVTIRQYIWLWPYRTRHIPMKEVRCAVTEISEASSGVPGGIDLPTYNVVIGVAGRKKLLKIGCLSKGRAYNLADRIKAFVQFK